MYRYINNYPKDRENGWSNEVNGVCHDTLNWYFTQNGNIWKFPITHDLNKYFDNADYKNTYYHPTSYHLGEIEYYNGYLFVAVSGKGEIKGAFSKKVLKTNEDKAYELNKINNTGDQGKIFVFDAEDLSFVRSVIIKQKDGSLFNNNFGYLAINPNNGLLYTSTDIAPSSYLHVYSIGSIFDKEMLTLHSTLLLYDENSKPLRLDCMQGGCFDDNNYLHLLTGFVTNYEGKDPLKEDLKKNLHRTGISVFKVSQNPTKGKTNTAIRVAHSGQSGDFAFQFDGTGDEPEGITYWDIDKARIELSNKLNIEKSKIAPNIEGQLHAIMLNNFNKTHDNDDDLYFKHYRRISNYHPTSPKPIKIEAIRYFSLKNNISEIQRAIKIGIGKIRQTTYQSITIQPRLSIINGFSSYDDGKYIQFGKENTIDLANIIGNINEGDVVWLKVIIKANTNGSVLKPEESIIHTNLPFIYRKASNKKACYTIKNKNNYYVSLLGNNVSLSFDKTVGSGIKTPKQIRYISWINDGEFAARIKVNSESGFYVFGQNIRSREKKTVDIADVIGKIKDGDEILLETIIMDGKNFTAGQRFIYRKTSKKYVLYKMYKRRNVIKGGITTFIDSLSWSWGIIECNIHETGTPITPPETPPLAPPITTEPPETSMTIRYISLKNNGGFAVRIRVKGGSESFESGSFLLGQEQIVDLANAVGKIKDGDMVWLEAVVKYGRTNTGGERFIYRKSSNTKACYSIKGTTLSNTLSYNGME